VTLGLSAVKGREIAGFRLEEVEEIPSTSDACIARAKAGEDDGLAILAESQTAARGSRGRSWSAPRGNLFLSVLLRPEPSAAADQLGGWSLLSGLVLLEALEACGADGLMLKWPNDVLRHGAKLGGVLVDCAIAEAGQGGGIDWLVIGFGANLAVTPEIAGRTVAGLGAAAPTPLAVTRALLDRLGIWRRRFAGEGLAPIRGAWLARAHPTDTPIVVRYGDTKREGLFAGLSPDGALLLRQGADLHAISTGDVLLSERG
jgi:BirA family biotin operon repressor/biotin-[acetyl-CoA-carboxylase] ligase